ncbi:hypothetical protein [Gluconacetobacter asukensis]|uniref:hypothetical protein n=1 Tax=Gluconacetobacter asukensis TaxID=1017181 RepID=UPI001FE8AD12|nr:hypothetical protein [Gluconacetobacter asukensis]
MAAQGALLNEIAAPVDAGRIRTTLYGEEVRRTNRIVLPSRPDSGLGYEYLPEEEVSACKFAAITAMVHDDNGKEVVDWAHLQCASGVCPI